MSRYSKPLGARIADKHDSQRQAQNPAAAEMIRHLDEAGIDTVLDRLESQNPQCGFGLRGTCCRMCQWGPCRISEKSPRGVCGRDMALVTMANLLRAVAAGASAQTMHAREMALSLDAIAHGKIALEIKDAGRLRDAAQALNVAVPWTNAADLPGLVAHAILDDLGRLTEGRMRTLGFAPHEQRQLWEEAGVAPRSTALEVLEALHMTTLGGCSDPEELFRQAIRTALAHAYSALVPSSVMSDILFGVPEPRIAEVNFGVLKPDHVNVLVHGHSAIMLEKVLAALASDEIQALARQYGAEGIVVGGMCCTGHESLARYGIPTVTGAMGQELVIGTGAIDAVVVDMQCLLPGMQAVAQCFGTQIVTTCNSNRIPGAAHIPFDAEKPETLEADALRVARISVEAFAQRDRSSMHIPAHTTTVSVGHTRESIMKSFGSVRRIVEKLRSGEIRGVVAMVGCTTPKIAWETGHVTIARELVRNGVLVLTSGCSSHALLNAGLCSLDAAKDAPVGLRTACEEAGVPPVLAIGSCADNTRIIQVFAQLANHAQEDLRDMPFVVSGPELAHEKTMGQVIAMLAHGITAVVGLTPQLPIPADGSPGSEAIADHFSGAGLQELLGSRLLVCPDPQDAVSAILGVLDAKQFTGQDAAE